MIREATHQKVVKKQNEEANEKEEAQQPQEAEPELICDNGDRFHRGDADLLLATAHQSIDFHKSIEDVHRGEEYARGLAAVTEKFNRKFLKKKMVRSSIPTTFPDEIRPKKNLMWKKGGSRRRAYTGREAAEAGEAIQRRARRKDSIEQGRRRRHDKLIANAENESVVSEGKNSRYKKTQPG